jgi:antitoxin CptB
MRELDVVMLYYLDHHYVGASASHQAAFRELVAMQDPDILDFLTGRTEPDGEALCDVVEHIRSGYRP